MRALTRPRAEEEAPLGHPKANLGENEAPRFEMDIFDLGMLLLVAAVGGYDVLLRVVSVAEGRRRTSSIRILQSSSRRFSSTIRMRNRPDSA